MYRHQAISLLDQMLREASFDARVRAKGAVQSDDAKPLALFYSQSFIVDCMLRAAQVSEQPVPTGHTQTSWAIERYVQARIADNDKGGGDPASYPEIEQELKEAAEHLESLLPKSVT